MGLSVSGLDDLIGALQQMAARVAEVTPDAVLTAQAIVEGEARARLSRYSHQPGTPTPSPPGAPPALVSGRLRSSFEIAGPTRAGAGAWTAVLGPTTPYARIQELGGQTGRNHAVTLPARPYLRPSAEAAISSGRLLDIFVRAWSSAITG